MFMIPISIRKFCLEKATTDVAMKQESEGLVAVEGGFVFAGADVMSTYRGRASPTIIKGTCLKLRPTFPLRWTTQASPVE